MFRVKFVSATNCSVCTHETLIAAYEAMGILATSKQLRGMVYVLNGRTGRILAERQIG